MFDRVSSVFYFTNDMDQTATFYRDVLGLDQRVRYGEDWAEFAAGGTTVALHGTRGAAAPWQGATVVFEVDDLEAAMRTLRARGVSFDGDVTEVPEQGRFATFKDPAGNVLQMYEPPRGEGGR